MSPASTQDLAAHLTALSDREIAGLLSARPDLLRPPAPNLSALALRAGSRPSVELALANMDAPTLAVAQALIQDAGDFPECLPTIAQTLDLPPDDVAAAYRRLSNLALSVGGRPVIGLVEALRGSRLSREELTAPNPQALGLAEAATIASEAAFAAEEAVRLTEALLAEWGSQAAPILRAGGVGVRTLNRTAQALEIEPAQAACVIETAAGAGLLGLDKAGAAWEPSNLAAQWGSQPVVQRWAPLALAWARSARTPWLVGTRDAKGVLRSVLAPDLEAVWACRLRQRVLRLLAGLPAGAMITPDFVCASLNYQRPRRAVPPDAVAAVLGEAQALGVLGSQALSRPGAVLARLARGGGELGSLEANLLAELEEALAADLPQAVAALMVQSDLTAIVPGRPEPELARLLGCTSVVESRGGALGVRFTPESVRGALDAGYTAAEIVEDLAGYSVTPLPSALTTLIQDAARRHGAVRVRAAGAILRVPDEAVAAGLLAQAGLKNLGLTQVAPGVLVALAPPGQVLRELREAGLSPALEDAHGSLVRLSPRAGTTAAPEPAYPGLLLCVPSDGAGGGVKPAAACQARALKTVVNRMRAAEAARSANPQAPITDTPQVLALLRQAQATDTRVAMRLVGADGVVQERRARVLNLEAGRVRLRDVVRDTELTVAAHRIVSVAELSAGGTSGT